MARVKVLEVLEANVGGARKHVVQLLRGLDRERFELHLACSLERDPGGEPLVEELRGEGIRVTTLRMLRRPSPLADLAALRQLTALLRSHAYHIVHTHASKAGFLGRLAARRAGVPAVLHTPHTFPFERVDTRLAPLYRWLERLAARWATRIVLVADSQRPTALDARLCTDDRLVAFVGRITPQKDVQTFLSAIQAVAAAVPGLRAFVVGGADNVRYLESLRPRVGEAARRLLTGGEAAAEPVAWSPSLPLRVLGHRADAAELVAAFDAVVLPSRYEGLPYSLLEAMACAVPPVASRVTGNRDAIEHERSGLLVGAGDVAGFARALSRLLADGELRARLAVAARERVAARFTLDRFLRQMTHLYLAVAAPPPPAAT